MPPCLGMSPATSRRCTRVGGALLPKRSCNLSVGDNTSLQPLSADLWPRAQSPAHRPAAMAPKMSIVVQPRIQTETWSLYWKESMRTATFCLAPITLKGLAADSTVADLQSKAAQQLKWPDVGTLLPLEGFSGPWERSICKGRALNPEATLAEAGLADQAVVTFVRIELVAEGWKVGHRLYTPLLVQCNSAIESYWHLECPRLPAAGSAASACSQPAACCTQLILKCAATLHWKCTVTLHKPHTKLTPHGAAAKMLHQIRSWMIWAAAILRTRRCERPTRQQASAHGPMQEQLWHCPPSKAAAFIRSDGLITG